MKKTISLKVNGNECSVEVEARTTLLDLVREQFGLTGAKLGCDIQVCGACTLLVDGKPVSACSMLAVDVDGAAIETIEGLSTKASSLTGSVHGVRRFAVRLLHFRIYSDGEGFARRMSAAFGTADSRLLSWELLPLRLLSGDYASS